MSAEPEIRRFRQALEAFDRTGTFGENDYRHLRSLVAGTRSGRGTDGDLLDGLVNLFFERHLLPDARRKELLELEDDALVRAVRHRFRQVLADAQDEVRPYRALRAQVRFVLERLTEVPGEADWPPRLTERDHFSSALVEQAVRALARDRSAIPTAAEATQELLSRYAEGVAWPVESQDVPEVLRRRIDGQRLAAGILRVLTTDEKELLRHVLDGGGVEDWAQDSGVSRATAYRMLSRLKALCRLEFAARSNCTQLEALAALRDAVD